ncbi:glycoside hydrolase family 3 N-terminal domain-containing protein [Nocardioides bruguierae]|uniref:Glycoside hydrolase family 3 N-terminal domain-containing protein n=1 Tax=Nocardioides bruguierae TaxID=2945102 RepID=A0A9X2D4N6_9ACTN|nr:glycoside hydrolase family 3 N-terminal domain-containing protein [Nocardioides bruguierae]MCM0618995.1 hypothetical protein [Nocardioides bruguierae]
MVALALVGSLAATATPATADAVTADAVTSSAASAAATAATTALRADDARTPRRVLRHMTLRQQVGQLLMVGTPADQASSQVLTQLTDLHVGNVMLTGRSDAGVAATAAVSERLTRRVTRPRHPGATRWVAPLVATDQEGGAVQVLSGDGFRGIPSALEQGTWRPVVVRRHAHRWGSSLVDAGVSMNLAPVLGTVPGPQAAAQNPPIGAYDREYGYTVQRVRRKGWAALAGFRDAGLVAAAKHFPGLGRVSANTDTDSGVTDTETGPRSSYLDPFAAAISHGAETVMMSSATYSRIDGSRPAVFSSAVTQDLLRTRLGFTGVVMTDDLGQAAQVQAWSPGRRAVLAVAAGADLVVTVTPDVAPAMVAALVRRGQDSPSFRRKIRASALRVLEMKDAHGLL